MPDNDTIIICNTCGTSANKAELKKNDTYDVWHNVNSHTKFVELSNKENQCIKCYGEYYEKLWNKYAEHIAER